MMNELHLPTNKNILSNLTFVISLVVIGILLLALIAQALKNFTTRQRTEGSHKRMVAIGRYLLIIRRILNIISVIFVLGY